jgi:hypothetical protein
VKIIAFVENFLFGIEPRHNHRYASAISIDDRCKTRHWSRPQALPFSTLFELPNYPSGKSNWGQVVLQ